MPIEFVFLEEEHYYRLYKEAFRKPNYTGTFTEEMHRAEFARLGAELRKSLSARWEEDHFGNKDFAIMGSRGFWRLASLRRHLLDADLLPRICGIDPERAGVVVAQRALDIPYRLRNVAG
jgi:hypothetical protein